MSIERKFQVAAYVLFIAVIFAAPVFGDEFWLNRISKYLVYGMLGVAIALT